MVGKRFQTHKTEEGGSPARGRVKYYTIELNKITSKSLNDISIKNSASFFK